MLLLRTLNPLRPGKEGRYDTFLAGLVGGYSVFGRGRQGSVNQQVSHYPLHTQELRGREHVMADMLVGYRLSSTSSRA
jgi:hypothetical protein